MLHESKIIFLSDGVPLVGALYRNTEDLDERQPAVVVSGSWLNVKEQMATGYAKRLAERGYTTFVFDFAGWGESKGALRHAELPASKARDMAHAVRFVASRAGVDPDRIAYLGICASAQYALRALATERTSVRALVSIAGWFHDAATVAPFYGGPDGVRSRLARAEHALARYLEHGELTMVPAYAPGDERAGMHFELDYYGNAARGAVAGWANEMAELSWLHWLGYDGLSPASGVTVPTLLVHGDGCALPDNARSVHAALRGKKALAWLGDTQQDYYDQPAAMNAALDHTLGFLAEAMPTAR